MSLLRTLGHTHRGKQKMSKGRNGSQQGMKIFKVINGQIVEDTRNLTGPYFNRNAHICRIKSRERSMEDLKKQ